MDLISLLVTVIILGLIFYVVFWALGKIALPEPFNKVAVVIVVLIAVVMLLGLLFGSFSVPRIHLR